MVREGLSNNIIYKLFLGNIIYKLWGLFSLSSHNKIRKKKLWGLFSLNNKTFFIDENSLQSTTIRPASSNNPNDNLGLVQNGGLSITKSTESTESASNYANDW